MKKLFVISAATIVLAARVNAQANQVSIKTEIRDDKKEATAIKKEEKEKRKELKRSEGNEVSDQAQQQFRIDFGDIPVDKWERTANFDEASFLNKGYPMTAYYDADAQLVGTITNVAFEDIPSRAQEYIAQKYPDYSREGVVLFDDNESNETDMIVYGARVDDADNYFVDLKKDNQEIILQVSMFGDVSFFKQLR
jgi:hypothetical protein